MIWCCLARPCDRPRIIESLRGKDVVDVACGGVHSAAITASGELYTWGKGRYGRLGHGDSDDQLKPKLVEALLGNGRAKNSLPVLFCVFPSCEMFWLDPYCLFV
jgi:alpha-tubulin suppressor-like RCC1 family protein